MKLLPYLNVIYLNDKNVSKTAISYAMWKNIVLNNIGTIGLSDNRLEIVANIRNFATIF